MGSVRMLEGMFGFHIFIVPSQELDRNVSLETRFQWTENTSRACSLHDCIGNWSKEMSKSLMLPSPEPVRIWFSWDSDQAMSYRESCVSNLVMLISHIQALHRVENSCTISLPQSHSQ
jgi:hypothetical protein